MECLKQINRCTIPLCFIDVEDKTSHLGTGVLIRTEKNYYLLSARHVFENDENRLNLETIDKVVFCKGYDVYPIIGEFACYPAEENIDIIVCQLENTTKEVLSQFFEFLPSDLILPSSRLKHTKDYYIVGYPIGKVKRVYPYSENSYERSLYVIETAGLGDDEFNFNVEYHRRKMKNLDTGLRTTAPKVKGMSGCGLWYKFQDNIYLVGIVHYFNDKKSLISATKIDYATDILIREFNDSYE